MNIYNEDLSIITLKIDEHHAFQLNHNYYETTIQNLAWIKKKKTETHDCHANDDNDGHQTHGPANSVGPYRVHVGAVLERLVLDPVEEQYEEESRRRDNLPHPRPEEPPAATAHAYHLLYVVKEAISPVHPRHEDALADGDQKDRPVGRVLVHQL